MAWSSAQIVEHAFQDGGVTTLGHRNEKIAGNRATAVRDIGLN